MNRRQFLVTASAPGLAVLTGCTGGEDTSDAGAGSDSGARDGVPVSTQMQTDATSPAPPSDTQREAATNTHTATETPTDTFRPAASPVQSMSYSGSGHAIRDDIDILGGLTIIEASHSGSSDFIVEFVPENGDSNSVMVDTRGDYAGDTVDLVEAGTYQLNVTASGDWEITIHQPRPNSGKSLPQSFTGEGVGVFGPLEFSESPCTATGNHDGSHNFIVEVYPLEGIVQTVVFNEVGEFAGETTFKPPGIGYLAVIADGSWTFKAEA